MTDTCSQSFKFTGKYRDSETGNDYFGARYYTSSFGRFLSPDWSAKVEPVPYAKLDNPQTLNLYLYADDNPESVFDADGHDGKKAAGYQTVQTGQCTMDSPCGHKKVKVKPPKTQNEKQGFFHRAWQWIKGKYQIVHNAYHNEQVWMASHPNVEAAILIGAAAVGGGEDAEGEGDTGATGGMSDVDVTGTPSVPPPTNPAESPGPGWEWKGTGPAGSSQGSWVNESTGETLHPDLQHGYPPGPHWDYTNSLAGC